MRRKSFIGLIVSVIFAQLAWSQSVEELGQFLQKTAKELRVPAMTVAVVKDGKMIVSEGFGKHSENDMTAPDENTLFGIASLSKAFTTASMGMLVDEGKLKWEDPVIKYLPWFKMYDPYVTEHMTIEDLLCHRSGLITFDGDLLWYGTTYTTKEAVERIQYYQPTYEFRTEFGYQNLMFMTAGLVIEAVSGMTWDDFVKQRILIPLEMRRTTSHFNEFITDQNIAKPYVNGEQIFMLSYDNSGATAALNSCTDDMSKWMIFWLNKGVLNGDTLLNPETIDRIWRMHTVLPTGNFDSQHDIHFKGYGMGWFLFDYEGDKVIHHGGGLPGYITKACVVPEQNLGIVVLTTDMSSASTMLMYAIIDWINGKSDYQSWLETFVQFQQRTHDREEKEAAERLATKKTNPVMLAKQAYIGTYRDDSYGDVKITLGKDGLIMTMLPTKELFSGKLLAWDDHAFRFDHNDPYLTYGIIRFSVEGNEANGFTMDLPNYDFHFDKLNFKRVE